MNNKISNLSIPILERQTVKKYIIIGTCLYCVDNIQRPILERDTVNNYRYLNSKLIKIL